MIVVHIEQFCAPACKVRGLDCPRYNIEVKWRAWYQQRSSCGVQDNIIFTMLALRCNFIADPSRGGAVLTTLSTFQFELQNSLLMFKCSRLMCCSLGTHSAGVAMIAEGVG